MALAPPGDLLSQVQEVLRAEFQLSPDEVRPEAHLVDDLDLDSVDAVALLVRLEEETGLEIGEEEYRSLVTVQSVVDVLSRHLP